MDEDSAQFAPPVQPELDQSVAARASDPPAPGGVSGHRVSPRFTVHPTAVSLSTILLLQIIVNMVGQTRQYLHKILLLPVPVRSLYL